MRGRVRLLSILLAFAFCISIFAPPAFAEQVSDGSKPYPGYTGNPYTKDPKELMTQEYFGNEWVNTIPYNIRNHKGELIPSPWDHHGYIAGSPARLTPYAEIYDYFRQLAERSPRVAMWNIGKSTGGRDMYIVAVSSADTIARFKKYQENLHKLADPRLLGYPEKKDAAEAAAEALIRDAAKTKPIFWVWAKCHSSETGSGEMVMELAYRLAVEEREMFKKIRDNVIVFITDPNPDGTDMVASWVNRYLGTKWDGARPPFYNTYIQHDNNREMHINSQPETLNLVKAYNQWPAQVVLDIHESVFLLFTFSGLEPTFPSIDPITQSEWQWLAGKELTQAAQFDMPGVWMYKYVNMYYPMYNIQLANLRNGTGKFYEVFGRITPTTTVLDVDKIRVPLDPGTPRRWYWYRPKPYTQEKIIWSFRNNINYSQTATLTTALEIANNRENILRNYWVKAKNAVSAPGKSAMGASGAFTYPHAYVVPVGQKDMPDTVKMINNLLDNGIEVRTARYGFVIEGKSYPAGSYIIRMDQPFSRLVYALLEPQKWPEGSPPPYDATGWQYGLIRDVQVDRIDDPRILTVSADAVSTPQIRLLGGSSPKISQGAYVIDHNSINNIVTLVFGLAKKGYKAYAAERDEGLVIHRGDIIVPAEQQGVYEVLAALVKELGLTMHSVGAVQVPKHELNVPRVAMYHSWAGVQDGGWSRFTFEQFGVPYRVIQDAEVREGRLKDKYDVIFLPDVSVDQIKDGVQPGSVPEEVWYGPIQTDRRTGGMGEEGIAALKEFVKQGGVLITNNASSELPIRYDFVKGISLLAAKDYNAPGPLVKIRPNLTSPITYGADPYEYIYNDRSPVFIAPESSVVASYPENPDEILASGYLSGANDVAGKAAIVDVPAANGTGRVIMFGTDITYRWQAFGAYFYLWNAILNWDD